MTTVISSAVEYCPWSLAQLGCRLEAIRELLSPVNPQLNTTDAVFQDLISTWDFAASIDHPGTFQKASDAFFKAKIQFLEVHPNQYSWFDEHCLWNETENSSINERRHDDILTYRSFNKHSTGSYSVLITFLATFQRQENIITLEIGSIINGQIIRLPIGQFSTNQDYTKHFQDDFNSELNNLIIAISKQRKKTRQQ